MGAKLMGSGPLVLVDDSRPDSLVVRHCFELSKLDVDFVCLESGNELITYLNEQLASGAPLPSVVLLDLKMPDRQGFDVLVELRRCREIDAMPVVILTGSDDPVERQRAIELGAAAFVIKPETIDELVLFFDSLA